MNNLHDVFDMKPVEVVDTNDNTIIVPADGVEEDVDYNYVRMNHYQLTRQAQEGMGIALRVAREMESPAAIKELAAILKASSEVNRQLLMLSKDKADVKSIKKTATPPTGIVQNVQQQVVFQGTSGDINRLLSKRALKEEDEI